MQTDYHAWKGFEGATIPSSLELHSDIFEYLKPGDRVIDLGCGYGKTCFQLAQSGFGPITGVDINDSGIRYAEDLKTSRPSAPQLTFQVDDVTQLSFPDSSFTFGIMQAVLTAIPDATQRARALSEASRVLGPGGLLYIACFCQTWHSALYRQRYLDAIREGFDEGSFPAYNKDTGALEYVAHHHSEKELVELLLAARFTIERFRFDTFKTRSGNSVNGMVLIARNAKDSDVVRS